MTADARRFGLDTHILVSAVEASGGEKARRADAIVRSAVATRRCVLSLQNIGEFYHVCVRKRRASPDAASQRAIDYSLLFPIIEPSMEDARIALGEASAGRSSYWDALLLATLGRSGCVILLSEDMQAGTSFGGVTVRDPLASDALPADLAALLS